jgi:hypothetical protein
MVYLGDNEPFQIVGKKRIKIKFHNGNHWLLHEIKHVPRLSKNLISTGQLDDEGCVITFSDKNWKVTKGALVVEKSVKVGTFIYFYRSNISFYFLIEHEILDS